ncbi:hypothetical protein ALC152_01410 [Arcobacter sp. 15-2]|uniref:hypothetical protein n=1 Tax=Arcobacter sp. 15-2 TaxID=3374109 RepID=UPI00399C9D48
MEIKSILIKEVVAKDGNKIKWFTHGSKKYISINIKDDAQIVFILNGNKEYLLSRALHLDAVIFQSDSIILGLSRNEQLQELQEKTKDKIVVVLLENDESSLSTLVPLEENLTTCKYLIPIKIEDLYLNYSLRKNEQITILKNGTDVINFINHVKDKDEFILTLKDVIKGKLRNLKIKDGSLENGSF